jgi:hypothetical protein
LDKLQQKMTSTKEKSIDSDKKEVKVVIKNNEQTPDIQDTPATELPSSEEEATTVVPE